MPEFKTKEEYEQWKAERFNQAKENTIKKQKESTKPSSVKKIEPEKTEKKCKYCAMMIPLKATTCPHCKKSTGWKNSTKIIVAFIIIFIIIPYFFGHKKTAPTIPVQNTVPIENPIPLKPEGRVAIGSGFEVKTLDDFRESTFIKKYPQKKQMTSWALRDGGYNNSFSFRLGNDEFSWFSVEVGTKSQNNPLVQNYGIMFHDESNPSIWPTKFTEQIKSIFQDFIKSMDSTLDIKNISSYVQEQSLSKYHQIKDAPMKTIGKYSFRVGTVGHDLIIRIDKQEH